MTFTNNLLKNIDNLPQEMIDLIWEYVPDVITIFLTKANYIEMHSKVRKYINKRNIENYIRSMIRQDNDFVFNLLLKENYRRWLDMKKCYYRTSIYSNYITFLESYAIDNESTKCRKLILNLMEELGLSKNQHKKNTIRYIRWRT